MQHSKAYWLFSDWGTAIQRSIKHTFRTPDALISGLALPILMMLLFVVVFSGAISTGTEYVNYIVPGVILICIGYGSSSTAMIINKDITGGLFDRFRTLPMANSAILIGHVTGSLIRNSISAVLVIGVALAIGFRPSAGIAEWAVVILLLLLAILAFSWLSIIFGLLVKSVDTAAAASIVIMFLPYLSSAFVPIETLPSWLRGFAEYQPLTPIIEATRGLLIGTPLDNAIPLAITWMVGILVVSTIVALLIYKAKSRR